MLGEREQVRARLGARDEAVRRARVAFGGIGSLAPTRRGDLPRLGLRAMIAGTLANFLTATIAGMLL